jgi:hypothetical protein
MTNLLNPPPKNIENWARAYERNDPAWHNSIYGQQNTTLGGSFQQSLLGLAGRQLSNTPTLRPSFGQPPLPPAMKW